MNLPYVAYIPPRRVAAIVLQFAEPTVTFLVSGFNVLRRLRKCLRRGDRKLRFHVARDERKGCWIRELSTPLEQVLSEPAQRARLSDEFRWHRKTIVVCFEIGNGVKFTSGNAKQVRGNPDAKTQFWIGLRRHEFEFHEFFEQFQKLHGRWRVGGRVAGEL